MANRIERIMPGGKAVILAFDQGFEHGPARYAGTDISAKRIFSIAEQAHPDALLVHKGMVRQTTRDVNLIVKVSGRTLLSPHEEQVVVSDVEDAIAVGADAIATTVYLGCDHEPEMMESFAGVFRACKEYGMPLVAFMYPRMPEKENRHSLESVSYAARVGGELGADIVKTYYTGDKNSWVQAVEACPTKLVAAGGAQKDDAVEALRMVQDIVSAGGAGIAIGRNVWKRDAAVGMLKAIVSIVHEGKQADEAAALL